MQSRLHSFVEAWANTLLGFVLSVAAGFVIYPLFGYPVTFAQNLGITMCFTIVSVIRSYVVRRYFNAKLRKQYAQG